MRILPADRTRDDDSMINQFTGIYKFDEFDVVFIEKMESVCNSILQAGFDPYSQLMGYLLTGEVYYVTRNGDARSIIVTLDNTKIQAYVKKYLEK